MEQNLVKKHEANDVIKFAAYERLLGGVVFYPKSIFQLSTILMSKSYPIRQLNANEGQSFIVGINKPKTDNPEFKEFYQFLKTVAEFESGKGLTDFGLFKTMWENGSRNLYFPKLAEDFKFYVIRGNKEFLPTKEYVDSLFSLINDFKNNKYKSIDEFNESYGLTEFWKPYRN